MLADRLEVMEKGKESRVAVVGEVKRKKKSSATKKSKRKYRLLEEDKTNKERSEDVFEESTDDGNSEPAKGSA
jgi:ABC-type glutathione transport system ATPase component